MCTRVFTGIALGISIVHLYSCLNLRGWYLQYQDYMNYPNVVEMVELFDADNCDQDNWQGRDEVEQMP
eukprot:COSAG02_NODE_23073_length_731_cov_0.892405_1_plen_67_part_10